MDAEGTALDDEPGSPGTVTVGSLLGTGDADDAVVLTTTPPVGWAEVPVPHAASTVTAATAQAKTASDFLERMGPQCQVGRSQWRQHGDAVGISRLILCRPRESPCSQECPT